MLRNTTFNLPDDLVARAKAYAANNGTTLTAIVRNHLEAVTADDKVGATEDPLAAFSLGRMTKEQAIKALGLRDYAELLVRLGEADLPLPSLPGHEIENQATTFARIWRQS
jgi:hypothetical protein